MRRGVPILLGLLLSAIATNSYAVNILINPGFEDGTLDPWFNSNDFCSGCSWSVSIDTPHSGVNDARVKGNRLLEQDFAPTDVSLISEASLWLRMPGTGIAAVFFKYSDLSTEEHIVSPTADWHKFDMTSFLDAGKDLIGFGVYGCTGCAEPGFTFADDFVVNAGAAIPEPGTLALMAIGGGVLAARRRRRDSQTR